MLCSIVYILYIAGFSLAASHSLTSGNIVGEHLQGASQTSSSSGQYYRRPISLGAPGAAVYSELPRVPIAPVDRLLFSHRPSTSPESQGHLQATITTGQATIPTVPSNRSKDANKGKRILRVKLNKGKKKLDYTGDNKAKLQGVKLNEINVASTSSKRPLDDIVATLPPIYSTEAPTQYPHTVTRPRKTSRILLNARRPNLTGKRRFLGKERKSPATVEFEKQQFLKEWKRKGLGTHLAASELAKLVWGMDTYQEEPQSMGRIASRIVNDDQNDRYAASYRSAMDRILTSHARAVKAAENDPNYKAMNPISKAVYRKRKTLERISNKTKVSGSIFEPRNARDRREFFDRAQLVGRIVSADMEAQKLDLNTMTIEDIEAKTRNIDIHPLSLKKATNSLHHYLELTRGMNETDFNVFRRNRRLYNQERNNMIRY